MRDAAASGIDGDVIMCAVCLSGSDLHNDLSPLFVVEATEKSAGDYLSKKSHLGLIQN